MRRGNVASRALFDDLERSAMKLTKDKNGIRIQGTADELSALAKAITAKVEIERNGGSMHIEFWYESLFVAFGLVQSNTKGEAQK